MPVSMPRVQALGVGDEEVVADELDLVAEAVGHRLPAVPVRLVEGVLDGDERVRRDEVGVVVDHLGRGLATTLEGVGPVLVELRGGDIEGEADLLARRVARLLDGLEDEVEGGPVGVEVGGEATLVAESGGQALLLEHALERVVDLGAPAQRLAEGVGADRRDHELLDVDVGVGVAAAVEDVHHRHGQQVRVGPADVAEQRQVGRVRGGAGDGERDPEDGVGADLLLGGAAVDGEHLGVDEPLLAGLEAEELGPELVDDGVDGLLDALAEVAALVAVAPLDGLEGAGRRTARNRRPGEGAVVEGDLDLDRGVAARVEDLASAYCLDAGHAVLLVLGGWVRLRA